MKRATAYLVAFLLALAALTRARSDTYARDLFGKQQTLFRDTGFWNGFADSVYTIDDAKFIDAQRVVLADARSHRIVLVDSESKKFSFLGRQGEGPGEFRAPTAVVPLDDGGVLAWDYMRHRLIRLTSDGIQLASWSISTSGPARLTILSNRRIAVVPTFQMPMEPLFGSFLVLDPVTSALDTVRIDGMDSSTSERIFSIAVASRKAGDSYVVDSSDYVIYVVRLIDGRVLRSTESLDESYQPIRMPRTVSEGGNMLVSIPNTIDVLFEVEDFGLLASSARLRKGQYEYSRYLDVISFDGRLLRRVPLQGMGRLTDVRNDGNEVLLLMTADGRTELPGVHVYAASVSRLFEAPGGR